MKKKKGAMAKSRATPRRSAAPKSTKSAKRLVKARQASRQRPRDGLRRELYPTIEPFRHGYLRVSDVREIYYEECGNPAGKPDVCSCTADPARVPTSARANSSTHNTTASWSSISAAVGAAARAQVWLRTQLGTWSPI